MINDSRSQKVQHILGGFKRTIVNTESQAMRTSENSSDLERGPGPRSIAVEFSEVRMAVQKLQRCEEQHFSPSCCTFWDPESHIIITSIFALTHATEGSEVSSDTSGHFQTSARPQVPLPSPHIAIARASQEITSSISANTDSTMHKQIATRTGHIPTGDSAATYMLTKRNIMHKPRPGAQPPICVRLSARPRCWSRRPTGGGIVGPCQRR